MEKLLLGIMLSLFFLIVVFNGCDAQTLSNLVLSSTLQATNSTVVVTVTATPATSIWGLTWFINSTAVGVVTFLYSVLPATSTLPSGSSDSIYQDRVNVSAAFVDPGASNQFIASLIIHELRLNDNGSVVSIDGVPATSLDTTLLVKDCPSTISSDITVEATSYIYNAQGTFICSNNEELFYSNGIRPSSSDTTCLASATWSGQDNLQCWSGTRDCMIYTDLTTGNLYVNDDIAFTCNYTDITPIGNQSIFYVGNTPHVKPKGEVFVLTLQLSDNNTNVSCQALTPYTQLFNETGRSLHNILLKVFERTCSGSDAENQSAGVCLQSKSQAIDTFNEGQKINVTNCAGYSCRQPLYETCRANGWKGGPSCKECLSDVDIIIIAIFSLIIVLCMVYVVYVVCQPHHGNCCHPCKCTTDAFAILAAVIGTVIFLALLIAYSVEYAHKCICYPGGYNCLTKSERDGMIAGLVIFYLVFSVIMIYICMKNRSDDKSNKDNGSERDSTPGVEYHTNNTNQNNCTTEQNAKSLPHVDIPAPEQLQKPPHRNLPPLKHKTEHKTKRSKNQISPKSYQSEVNVEGMRAKATPGSNSMEM